MIRMRGNEAFQRDHERSHAAFHVRGTAAVQQAVTHFRNEWIGGPGFARAGRHHVGVAEQHQHRSAVAMHRPEVVDIAETQRFAAETGAP